MCPAFEASPVGTERAGSHPPHALSLLKPVQLPAMPFQGRRRKRNTTIAPRPVAQEVEAALHAADEGLVGVLREARVPHQVQPSRSASSTTAVQ